MCGIVGYIGQGNTQDILIAGLKRLEYRGYDSAGIAVLSDKGKVSLVKSVGKVELLEDKLQPTTKVYLGIGHTRWATHGVPSERNAHPHKAGDVYIAHNGIIENYKELKANLKEHEFISDTDSEVLAALIDHYYKGRTSLVEAVSQALKRVIGTYGLVVMSPRQPDQVIAARMGSPLIIGVGKNETLIASDASALIGQTSRAIYLNDGEIAVCSKQGIELRDLSAKHLTPTIETIETSLEDIQKQGYDHFLIKEICEQPSTLEATLRGRLITKDKRVQLGGLNLTPRELNRVSHLVIVGCGTAYYAGLLASYYIERLVSNITIEVVVASEFRYRSFYLPTDSLAIIVSQSGETLDTLACLQEIKRRGVKTLGVVNVVGSTIARAVDGGIYVHAGPEISVASTKAFTSQVVAMSMFGLALAQAKGVSVEESARMIQELDKLPEEIAKVIKKTRPKIKEAAKHFAKYDQALYVGRNTLYPTALEGALKLKELSYIHAEGYPMGELKHGPIALVDNSFFEVVLIQDNWLMEKSLSGLQEIRARNGKALVITNTSEAFGAEVVISLKTSLDIFVPLLFNVVQQIFAYYIATIRGNNVDRPRNLAKSVTVE